MALQETNSQYYSGQKSIDISSAAVDTFTFEGFNTPLISAYTSAGVQQYPYSNFKLTFIDGVSGTQTDISPDTIFVSDRDKTTLNTSSSYGGDPGDLMVCTIIEPVVNDNYGSYSYVSLDEIINNFMIAYVGEGKLISRVKKVDVLFHAKRGLQEFSYDTLRSNKSQELTVPPSLTVPIPQDYVNYVKLSSVDSATGIKRIIYPTRLTSNPTELPIQDNFGIPTQDSFEQNLEAEQSLTEDSWKDFDTREITGYWDYNADVDTYDYWQWRYNLGERYGLDPEITQSNGYFTINERLGKISFSSNLAGALIIFEYLSDGLANDEDIVLPKMAEEAMYMHIAHAVLASRANTPEYVVQRYKRERSAALRNAKIRLSNIKMEEFTQIMRGKSKWIKH
jgi:hypothetical protein